MLIQEDLSVQEKLKILTNAAKYGVACTSSGVREKEKAGSIGNASEAGICHSFSVGGRCISLLKILSTNQCIYDCKYCMNRCSNDVMRTASTPDGVCKLTIEFYRRNYIEGLFLSLGVLYNANHTMELIYETLHKLRSQWHSDEYTHVKTTPGTDPKLVERMSFLADRMSINLELPTAERLEGLAPGKTRDKILKPMRQVRQDITVSSYFLGYDREFKKVYTTGQVGFADGTVLIRPELAQPDAFLLGSHGLSDSGQDGPGDRQKPMEGAGRERRHLPNSRYARTPFVPAGQNTQMVMGATLRNDYQMMAVMQTLCENYGLKRVFCSAYMPVSDDSCLPFVTARPPLLREHRLYQADWLLQFYGFKAEELLSEEQSNFNVFLNPKYDQALRHLELFPVEINRASYGKLLRVPNMRVKSARRVVNARKQDKLLFEDLKEMGVAPKWAGYFIIYRGHTMEGARLDQDCIASYLVGDERRRAWDIENKDSFRQLNLFDNVHSEMPVTNEDHYASVTGSL